MKSAAGKMGIKAGMRSIFVNAPAEISATMDLPEIDLKKRLAGSFDLIHFFATTQKQFAAKFPKLKSHLNPKGMLGVSWPKSGQLKTDLSIAKVIELGYDFGLVESTTISVDETWSAIKFTHPKAGKVYQNSYGTLKRD